MCLPECTKCNLVREVSFKTFIEPFSLSSAHPFLHTDNNNFISIGTYLHASLSCRVCLLLKITKLCLRVSGVWGLHMKNSRHMYDTQNHDDPNKLEGCESAFHTHILGSEMANLHRCCPRAGTHGAGRPTGSAWSCGVLLHVSILQSIRLPSGSASIAPRWLLFTQDYCLPFGSEYGKCAKMMPSLDQD